MSLLPEKLKSFDYYKQKVPMFLRTESFLSHFKLWYDLLVVDNTSGLENPENYGISNVADMFFDVINIFDDRYFEKYSTNVVTDILDKIGLLFGVSRNIVLAEDDDLTEEQVNVYFRTIIQAKIVQNYYDGSYEKCVEFYEKMNFPIFIVNNGNPASATVYLNSQAFTDNIYKSLFTKGYFTLKSMGITYTHSNQDLTKVLIWDSKNWDTGEWAI